MDKLVIGIDCGKHTGMAVWNSTQRKFTFIDTVLIHQAMEMVLDLSKAYSVLVVFEDARQRRWYGHFDKKLRRWVNSPEDDASVLQGAGSVKRDATIWEDFLLDHGISHVAAPPVKGGTKWDAKVFRRITGWQGRTSEHSRDAAILVFGK